MNLYKTFYLILLFVSSIFSQVITTEPPFATENDSIIIYFDATQADRTDLLGYTGDLYTHTGVNTNIGNWQHVIGNWGVNTAQPKLTRIETDYYKLVISYPREFYSVTNAGEEILELAFVFRSADASKKTEDIFYTLYEPGLTALFAQPLVDLTYGDSQRSPVFVNPGETVEVITTAAALGVEIDSILLKTSTEVLASTTEDSLFYDFIPQSGQQGNNQLTTVVFGSGGVQDSASIFVMVNPQALFAPLPAGTQDGINYISSTSVTLSLFAPYKEFVYLVGDFNDWKVDQAYLMNKDLIDTDSTHYWLTLDGLTPGYEYAFQYLLDGEIRIADPYTDKVLDPWHDQYISDQTYPNLKPYPDGKTGFPVSVFQTVQEEYLWQYNNFTKPAQPDLVIYELLLRDFLAAHDYATLTDTLDYLQNLGINAIELMPVNEFEGNESWGYNPSFYFALDKYYGSKNSFKQFVDACHKRGIAVIIDMVLNHSYGQSPFVRLYNEGDYGKPTPENPWYNVESPNPVYSWGYDFNHESQATKKLVDRVNRYWIEEYKVDGFRFDFTKGFTNTPGDGGAYDGSRISILKRMADAIWKIDSTTYIILEHFADNFEEKELADYGMMLWGNSNYNYNEASMGWISNSNFSWGYYKSRNWTKPGLVTYMESHDEERLMYKNLEHGNSSGAYNIKEMSTALNRQKLVGAFFFTIPGPKMIWQFGELGYDVSIDYNGRVGNKPIRWEYLQDGERKKLYKTWAALLKLRNENVVFTNPQSIILDVGNTVKRISFTHTSMNVRIVGNFGVTAQDAHPNFPYAGTWYDYFSGDTLVVQNTLDMISLEPGEFHIFTDQKLETPEAGLLTDILKEDYTVQMEFSLSQNYPNPFNPTTTIKYQLPEVCQVELILYNVLGQKVQTLVNKRQIPGSYTLTFDASILTSGLYYYQLKTNSGYTVVRKMMLIK